MTTTAQTLTIIYEDAPDGSVSARIDGLPVYSVGDDREDAERSVIEALALHLADDEDRAESGESSSPAKMRDVASS